MENPGRKLSICLIHEEYPIETGGAGIATYQATMAKAFKDLGHTVLVVARTYEKERKEWVDGIEVHRIKGYLGRKKLLGYVGYLLRLRHYLDSLLKQRKLDIIECPEWQGEGFLLQKIKQHPPVVVRLHGGQKVIGYHSRIHFSVHRWAQAIIEKLSIVGADLVTSPSRTMIEETEKQLNIRLPDAKMIPNPVNQSAIESDYQELTGDNRTVLFVGRLSPIKGFPILFSAVPKVVSELPGVRFIFVGRSGQGTKQIDPTLEKNVVFTGPVDYREVLKFYGESAICVFPSVFEPFGLVVLEAMAAGRPVLLSDIGSFREIITEGVHGRFFRSEDPEDLARVLLEMFLDGESLKKMGMNGKDRVKDFSPLIIASKTIDEYLRCCDQEGQL